MTKMQKYRKQFKALQPLWDLFETAGVRGWSVRPYKHPKNEYKNEDYIEIELETWSPAGEDIIEYLRLGDSEPSIYEQLYDLYHNYDWEEHAEPLIEMRGEHGIPDSIMTLVEDAQAIGELYEELYQIADKYFEEADNK